MKRVIAAFFLAPAIGLLALELLMSYPLGTPVFSGLVVMFGAMFAYPCAFGVGVPLFVLFSRRKWLKWWTLPLAGVVVGSPAFAFITVVSGTYKVNAMLETLWLTSVTGAVAGAAFWFIAVFRNSALAAGFRGDATQASRA